MTYESERTKQKEKELFYARMALYINSKSIEEYVVERDIKCLNGDMPHLTDIFIWWYLFKEKMLKLLMVLVASIAVGCIGVPVLIYFLASSIWWAIGAGCAIALVITVISCLINECVNELGRTNVPYDIRGERSRMINFEDFDASTASMQLQNEKDE